MAETPVRIFGTIPTSSTTVYTVLSSTKYRLIHLQIAARSTAGTIIISVTDGTNTAYLCDGLSLAVNTTKDFFDYFFVAGDQIKMSQTTSTTMTYILTGIEIT